MSVRVNNTWSEPLPVYGGVPQGSILGVLLFNISTDDLEDDPSEDHDQREFLYTDSDSTGSLDNEGGSEDSGGTIEPGIGDESFTLGASTSGGSTAASFDSRLNPDAPTFVPASLSWGSPAPRLNITDEVLRLQDVYDERDRAWPRSPEPPLGEWGSPAAKVNITDEVLSHQPQYQAELERPCLTDDPPHLQDELVQPSVAGAGAEIHTSTPRAERGRPRFRQSPVRRHGPRLTNRDWSFMPGRRNRRRRRNLQKRINYTNEGELSIEPETNRKATGLRWRARPPRTLKFVDDGMFLTKINMDSLTPVPGGPGERPGTVSYTHLTLPTTPYV